MKGRRIIIATDLSDNAAPAARWGWQLSQRLGLEVTVVHVIDITLKSWKGTLSVLEDPELRLRAEARLRAWFEQHSGGQADEVVVAVGSTLQKLTDLSARHDAALLVIGMSGRGAWNKFVFGSTALRIVHAAPCPVAVVHPEHDVPSAPYNIAIGTDFSETSTPAIALGCELARVLSTHVDIVHASVLPSNTVILDTELPEELRSTAVVDWAERAMARFADDHADALEGVDYDCHVVVDSPVRGLLDFVDQHGIDLLALGHYGRSASAMTRRASVMIKAVQHMRCTTLIVPG